MKQPRFNSVNARVSVAMHFLNRFATRMRMMRQFFASERSGVRRGAWKKVDEPSILQENGETAVCDLAVMSLRN
jgi:hypothetical protein